MFLFLAKFHRGTNFVDTFNESVWIHLSAVTESIAAFNGVVLSKFNAVHSQFIGNHVEVRFKTEEKFRVTEPAVWSSWRKIGVNTHGINFDVWNAVIRAAEDARDQIFDTVSRALDKDLQDLYLEDECVKSKTEPNWSLPLKNFIIDGIMKEDGTWRGGPIVGRGMFMPEFTSALSDPETSQGGKPNVHYTVGAGAVSLEIDKQTGRMKPLKIALAIDCGRALNPDLVKGQMTGGMLQGLATVLYEDMRFNEDGKLLNPNFTDYKIPTALDLWDDMDCIIVETPQPDGPFGARGMGEHTMIPCAPMVANAIHDALGLRIKSMPVTAEKVALAVEKAKK